MAGITYDVIVIGGSLGGVSAALSAAKQNANVCLIEATSWLGGQFTAQGVTKPDENEYIETCGSSPSYQGFRHAVRAFYRNNYKLSADGAAQPEFNPGGPYPGFTMQPLVGHNILNQLLTALPNVHVRLNNVVTQVQMNGAAIASIMVVDPTGASTPYSATYYLDATDLGDVLAQSGQQGTDWIIGAESFDQTAEPRSQPKGKAQPTWIQSVVTPFAIEHRPAGENHTIPQPTNYDHLKPLQGYTITDGDDITTMFGPGDNMWNYRSVIAAANFADPAFPTDLTIINTTSNDYQGGTIPTGDPAQDAAIIAQVRQASLGYLYWLQTECPRNDGSGQFGFPELKLRPDLFNTADGTSAQVYIRESRRILAMKTVIQQDIDRDIAPGPRATLFTDSCGIGYYSQMDIHACAANGTPGVFLEALPYQVPLSALIPVRLTNLLPSCKNIGTTHLTNGAYRLHPTEWAIGEAAGALVAFCIQQNATPASVPQTPGLLKSFQRLLLAAGIPIYWWADITADLPVFTAVQLLGVHGIASGDADMNFLPNNILSPQDQQDIEGVVGPVAWPAGQMTRGQAAQWLVQQLQL